MQKNPLRLVQNWREIVKGAHSMWALYLGIICLNAPDLIYLIVERDTDPALWAMMGNALFAYGAFGRIRDQGISDA